MATALPRSEPKPIIVDELRHGGRDLLLADTSECIGRVLYDSTDDDPGYALNLEGKMFYPDIPRQLFECCHVQGFELDSVSKEHIRDMVT